MAGRTFAALLFGFALASAAVPVAWADTLRVLATGVFEHATRDLAETFRRETGTTVALDVVNGGEATRRIGAGADYDLLLTASAGIDALAANGRVTAGSKTEIGLMRLGAGVKEGDAAPELGSADALRTALLATRTVAYIDPNGGGTSGALFGTLFRRLGVADAIRDKSVLCATGSDVDEALRSGRATLGMTQASEIIGAAGVRFAGYLPDAIQLVTPYAAAIPAASRAPETAARFVAFLTGPEGQRRLVAGGWRLPEPARP